MSTEIYCTLITTAGAVFSVLLSWFTSRSTANKEIEKLKMSWEREDIVSSDDEFAEMASAVALFVQCDVPATQYEAMQKIAALRSKEVTDIAELLDSLYLDVHRNDRYRADSSLTKVLNKKREIKRNSETPRRNKPEK